MTTPQFHLRERLPLLTEAPEEAYLKADEVIDYNNAAVAGLVEELRAASAGETDFVRRAFEFVRDGVPHSWDAQEPRVTCNASDVLKQRTGICYAKSHLLAALLRGGGVPAGFAYQKLRRLPFEMPETDYCIHAMNTVFLSETGKWQRIDARGNREGVKVPFSPGHDCLAFPLAPEPGEVDYRDNLAKPHPLVVGTLRSNRNALDMYKRALLEDLPLSW
jgi:transglutaminase-like putative cysteine protease